MLVVSRRADRLVELATSLADARGQIAVLAGDVTEPQLRQAVIDEAQAQFGGLDLLVNNAGSGAMGRFDEAGPDRLRHIMEVNFFAAAELTRLALPLLKLGQRPIVVNVDSVLAHRAVPGCSEYCASKFALRGLSESLRAELAPSGVEVLCASPARTDTEFFQSVINPHQTGWPGIRGMPADQVARKIVRAVRSGRHEVVISASGKLFVWGNRLMPRLYDYVLGRSK